MADFKTPQEPHPPMISIPTYNSYLYDRHEVWFNEEQMPTCSANNTIFYQSKVAPKNQHVTAIPFHSSIIDLKEPIDTIFGNVNSTFRNHIRRADKNEIQFSEIENSSEIEIDGYLKSYNQWAISKNKSAISSSRVKAILAFGGGRILKVSLGPSPLAFHLYVSDGSRARMVTSHTAASDYSAKIIGYANKMLHFEAIKYFKAKSLVTYDFGGIDFEKTPGIAQFKSSFGGREETTFNFTLTKGMYSYFKKIQNLARKTNSQ